MVHVECIGAPMHISPIVKLLFALSIRVIMQWHYWLFLMIGVHSYVPASHAFKANRHFDIFEILITLLYHHFTFTSRLRFLSTHFLAQNAWFISISFKLFALSEHLIVCLFHAALLRSNRSQRSSNVTLVGNTLGKVGKATFESVVDVDIVLRYRSCRVLVHCIWLHRRGSWRLHFRLKWCSYEVNLCRLLCQFRRPVGFSPSWYCMRCK